MISEAVGVDLSNAPAAARLSDDLGLDSLEMLIIYVTVEELAGADPENLPLARLENVSDVIDYFLNLRDAPTI